MLYEKTEAAICDLLSTSAQTHGPIRIIFDLDTQAVSASFLSEEEAVKEFYLHPSEFFVDCTLHQADEIGVAIRAAAFNAVSGLADIVDIEQEKGDSPNLYGTMTLPGGEVVPYDEAVMSFVHDDCCINDPTLSECGRFAVDPSEQYGFDLAVRYGRQCLVRQLHNGELQLTGPMNQGLPEKGNPANTLTRLAAGGEVLAYARIDQIRTGEDYPEDIASLTTRAQSGKVSSISLQTGSTEAPPAPSADYVIYGLSTEDSRAAVERAINTAINAGLEVAMEQEDLQGGIATGPAGDAMRLDIGSPFLFDMDVVNGIGKLSIPTKISGTMTQDEASEALDWVIQQGEMRVKHKSSTSPEAQLLGRITLGITPDRQINLATPEPGL